MGLPPPSETSQTPSGRLPVHKAQQAPAASHRVSIPSAYSPPEAAALGGAGLPHPHRMRPQVFSTSWRLDPLQACRPCFMPDPPMGFTLRSFAPHVEPYAVSSAAPLMSLGPTRCDSASGSSPSPHSKRSAGTSTTHRPGPSGNPRLQGIAPHESPLPRVSYLH
jgi:hypothetical protein